MDLRTNPESHKKWFIPLGKLIINFGTIDYIITQYIITIDSRRVPLNDDFEDKVKYIINQIEQLSLDQTDKRKLRKALNKCIKVYGFRNSIVHSPIISDSRRDRSKELALLIDFKKRKGVKLEEIDAKINEMVSIGNDIYEILIKLKS